MACQYYAFDGSDSTATFHWPRWSSLRLDVDLVAGKAYQFMVCRCAEIEFILPVLLPPLSIEDAETELNIRKLVRPVLILGQQQLLYADSDLDYFDLPSIFKRVSEMYLIVNGCRLTVDLWLRQENVVVDSNKTCAYVLG